MNELDDVSEAFLTGSIAFIDALICMELAPVDAICMAVAVCWSMATLFNENVRFILRNELMVGRAHEGGRTLRAPAGLFRLRVDVLLLLLFWFRV